MPSYLTSSSFNLEYLYFKGCENLMKSLVEIRDKSASNNSDSMDLCICADDIYSKTDVWREVGKPLNGICFS